MDALSTTLIQKLQLVVYAHPYKLSCDLIMSMKRFSFVKLLSVSLMQNVDIGDKNGTFAILEILSAGSEVNFSNISPE